MIPELLCINILPWVCHYFHLFQAAAVQVPISFARAGPLIYVGFPSMSIVRPLFPFQTDIAIIIYRNTGIFQATPSAV